MFLALNFLQQLKFQIWCSDYVVYSVFDETKVIAKSDMIVNEHYNADANAPKVLSMSPEPTTIMD